MFSDYFKSGCKDKNQALTFGVEVEHFLIRKSTGQAVSYFEKQGVEALLWKLKPYYEKGIYGEGHLLGLYREECIISLEPAGQLEVSIKAFSSVDEIMRAYYHFLHEAEPVLESLDMVFAYGGYHPVATPEELELIPKARYRYMDAYFDKIGVCGKHMMRATASTQVSIDYYSEEDFVKKYKVAYGIIPALYELCENTPQYGKKQIRKKIWDGVDPRRVDITPFIKDKSMDFGSYESFVKQIPVIVKPVGDGSDEYEYSEKTIGELCEDGCPSREEIAHYLSMAFPMVRLKKYIEIRVADSLEPEYLKGYIVLLKAIFTNVDYFYDIADGISKEDLLKEAKRFMTKEEKEALSVLEEKRQSMDSWVMDLIEKDYDGQLQSARNALEELKNSSAKYRGMVVTTRYVPKFFTDKQVEVLRDAAETMAGIMDKSIREYLQNESFRKKFSFSKEEEAMILNAPKYDYYLPVARVDIFFDEKTYEYKFCELNTDGSSAMNEDRELARVYANTRLYEKIGEKYKQEPFELFDSLVKAFLEHYATVPGAVKNPHVAVIDFLELGCSTIEFDRFSKSFEAAGVSSAVYEIRDLTYDGVYLYGPDGKVIDLIYRRAVTSDILEHKSEVLPFLQAVKDKNVCVMGDFCTQVAHDKSFFHVLTKTEELDFLSEREKEFIKKHVPYTTDLTPDEIISKGVKENKEKWIIKPKNSYGSHGVYAGVNTPINEWEKALKECSVCDENGNSGYVLQEFVHPYRSYNLDARVEGDFGKQKDLLSNLTGLYVYFGKFAGVYSRQARGKIISSLYDEIALPTIRLTDY
ncbi:MAG: hypothetical protein IJX86_01840 [Lachnospiraceae bacterium]|nr:hypothetical protein [Lachnospiraceae bacterium]